MTRPHPGRDRFLASLAAIRANSDTALSDLERELSAGLVAYGSETPDNLAAAARLGVRDVPKYGDRRVVGPAIGEHGVLVSDILNLAESADMPASVQEEYPQLAQSDWEAAMRLATLIMTAWERTRLVEDDVTEADGG